jgi:hypothetical protein
MATLPQTEEIPVTLNTRIPFGLRQELETVSKELDISMQAFLVEALESALKLHKKRSASATDQR